MEHSNYTIEQVKTFFTIPSLSICTLKFSELGREGRHGEFAAKATLFLRKIFRNSPLVTIINFGPTF